MALAFQELCKGRPAVFVSEGRPLPVDMEKDVQRLAESVRVVVCVYRFQNS